MYHRVLELIGEDPEREGLERNTGKSCKSNDFLTMGYQQNPCEYYQFRKVQRRLQTDGSCKGY